MIDLSVHRRPIWVPAIAIALCLAVGPSQAQDATPIAPSPSTAAKSPGKSAQADAGEPRANTSAPVAPPAVAPPPASSSAAPPTSPPGTPPPAAGARKAAGAPKAAASKGPGAADRVDLGTATVTGDREQPKVMYVVPWKSSDIGDLSGKPMNSLLDEALAPVDRDEFRREVAYFDAIRADRPDNRSANPATKQVEK